MPWPDDDLIPGEFELGDDDLDADDGIAPPTPWDDFSIQNPDSDDYNPDLNFSNYNTGLQFSQAYDDYMQSGNQTQLNSFFSSMLGGYNLEDVDLDSLYESLMNTSYFKPDLNRIGREYQLNLKDLNTDYLSENTNRKYGQSGLTFGSGLMSNNLDSYSSERKTVQSDYTVKKRGFFSDVGESFWDIIDQNILAQLGDD